ncbi:MAG: hypothetical protein ACKOWF_06005 [Chloroflexota bacterium]
MPGLPRSPPSIAAGAGAGAGAGWLLSDAFAINDAGWIAGQGAFMGQRRGYLLVPAPTA